MNQQLLIDSQEQTTPIFVIACSLAGDILWCEGNPAALLNKSESIVGENINDAWLSSSGELHRLFEPNTQFPKVFSIKNSFQGTVNSIPVSSSYKVLAVKPNQHMQTFEQTILLVGLSDPMIDVESSPQQDQSFFAAVIDAIADPVFVKNKQHEYILVNKACTEFLSISKQEIIGKSDYDFAPKQEAEKFHDRDKHVFKTGLENIGTDQVADSLGNAKLVSTKKTLVNANTLVGVVRDITEVSRLQIELEEQEKRFRSLAENSPDLIARWNLDGEHVYVNPKANELHKLFTENVEGHVLTDPFAGLREGIKKVIETQQSLVLDKLVIKGNGLEFIQHVVLVPEFNEQSKLQSVLGIGRDLTEVNQLNNELTQREVLFRSITENSPDCIARFNSEIEFIYVNSNAASFSHVSKNELIGSVLSDDFAELKLNVQKVINTQQQHAIERMELKFNDQLVVHNVMLIPEFDEQHQFESVLVIGRDITEVGQLQNELLKEEQSFRRLAENMPDIIIRYDLQLRRLFINKGYQSHLRVSQQAHESLYLKRPSEHWVCTDDINDAYYYEQQLQKALDTNAPLVWHQHFVLSENAQLKEYECRAIPELDESKTATGVLLFARDVSEQREFEEKLQFLANHDALTGLGNRRFFSDKINDFLSISEPNFAVLFLDLDRFKPINDQFGHEVGDAVLKVISERLKQVIQVPHEVARLGGDEFAILINRYISLQLDEFIEEILRVIAKPIALRNMDTSLSGSIGVALYPESAVKSEDELLRYADQAMYIAKANGRNGFHYFDIKHHQESEKQQQQIKELSHALNNDQITVYFQPIVDAKSQKVVKAEALVRWQHPEKGLIPPIDFIPLAEATGLIIELGNQVFQKAANFAKYFNQFDYVNQLEHSFKVSINISAKQLSDPVVINKWLDYLYTNDIAGSFITIELTESLLIDDNPQVIAQLAMLQQHGVTISLDDFGTGYSALSYLKKFNFDYLKIDRSFVKDINVDESDRAIVEAIILMANRLGIKLVAEGVEEQEQTILLRDVGCDLLQGYLYSKPIPETEFIEWLKL